MTKPLSPFDGILQLLLDKPREYKVRKLLHGKYATISNRSILQLLLDKPRECEWGKNFIVMWLLSPMAVKFCSYYWINPVKGEEGENP